LRLAEDPIPVSFTPTTMDITSTSTKGSQLPRRYKCKYEGCGKAFTKVGLFVFGGWEGWRRQGGGVVGEK